MQTMLGRSLRCRERRGLVTGSPCILLEPTLLGRSGPGLAQAGKGAKHAGPGLPPRPKYPSSLGKAGAHSTREGSEGQGGRRQIHMRRG